MHAMTPVLTWLLLAADSNALIEAVKRSDTAGMVILDQGRTVAEYQPDKAVHVQSVSKTMLSLAAGCLRTDGKLPSIEVTLGAVLPELKNDPKGVVTMRQLMAHVSGVAAPVGANGLNTEEFKRLKDTRRFAFAQPMNAAPGTKYRYNNTGMILLGAMLERIAGEPVPRYLGRRLFAPMGIRSAKWLKDGAGNAYGYMGLVINAQDLAKLGQLVLEEGRWDGKQLVDAEWMRESTQRAAYPEVNPNVGLVWMRQGGEAGQPPLLIQHSGDGGNWLMVFPGLKVVAARVRDSSSADSIEFPKLVYQQFRKQ